MNESEINEIFKSITDKDSSLYKEASVYGDLEETQRHIEAPDPLKNALKEAIHLDETKKARYLTLAEMYLSDMEHNLFKNQFDLANRYTTVSKDEWNEFLSDRIVSVYINKHKRTLLKTAAENNLSNPVAKNKRDSLQLIKNIEEQQQTEENKNICIIRIPDIYED